MIVALYSSYSYFFLSVLGLLINTVWNIDPSMPSSTMKLTLFCFCCYQDPENKKIIICDEKLKKIFKGNERVGFLEVAGLISPHFL